LILKSQESEIESLKDEKTKIQESLTGIENECEILQKDYANYKTRQEADLINLEETRSEAETIKIRLAEISLNEKNNVDKTIFFTKEINESEERIKKSQDCLTDVEAKITESQNNLEKISALIETLESELNEFGYRKTLLLEEKEVLYKKNIALEEELTGLLEELSKYIEFMHENEIKKIEAESRKSEYYEKLKELEINTDDLDLSLLEAIDIEKTGEIISRLKKFIKNFGGVNLSAEDDHRELTARYEFITKQLEDLQLARESLMNVIKEYDQECTKRFQDVFEKADKEFSRTFVQLFNGGEARLVLCEPENILETGVDIIVKPPGKKQQSLNLLSGGEKALTSVAFLFALLKIKSSPFVILDELDAPLDEANTIRVINLIKEYSKDTQFIIVTHNKKTMEAADILYGVTIEEKGVSKIISVVLEEAA
jgi:chromosome segregation protein